MNRRSLVLASTLVAAVVALSGCSKKADTTAGSSTSDSLLASSPVEQPQGQIQPQQGMTQPEPSTSSPSTSTTPTPKPAKKPSGGGSSSKPTPAPEPSVTVPAGTGLDVTVNAEITSETAQAGQSWSGTIANAVTVGSAAPFPAGSVVHGVVEGAKPAQKGDRAVLVLRVTSIEANGKTHEIGATADSIIAGSTRARNVGAVAGGAAAGAILGKAIGGSNKGALIGGLIGGAAATGAVASTKGYQAVVKEGTKLTFHVNHDTKVML